MKNKKLSIIVIAVGLILALAAIGMNIFNKGPKPEKPSTKTSTDKATCVKKGNICDQSIINEGIKLSIDVSDTETKEFYVLSNDANEMMNFKTFDWKKLDKIKSFTYKDYGYSQFQKYCANGAKKGDVDCPYDNAILVGYESYEIKDGNATIKFNPLVTTENKSTDIGKNITTRLPSLEEITEIEDYNSREWLVDALAKDSCYWTLSSSMATNTYFSNGAYAICNTDGKPAAESLEVHGTDKKVYARPVIVVQKEA